MSTILNFKRLQYLPNLPRYWPRGLIGCCLAALLFLSGCAIPRVRAEDRLFLSLSADFVDTYALSSSALDGVPVGGLSAITYDIQRDRYYALSDDRGRFGPPRFYVLRVEFDATEPQRPRIGSVEIESVTLLKDAQGNPYEADQLDPEGIALTPLRTLLIASEGSAAANTEPLIGEYDLEIGQLQRQFQIPDRYLPDRDDGPNAGQTKGVQENLSFEALAINASSGASGLFEPYRLFVATEAPLLQDLDPEPDIPLKNRFLHYYVDQYQSTLLSEHLYPMDFAPSGAVLNGLSEILVVDQSGHFLGLERAFGLQGFSIKLYQLATGGATDISAIATLKGSLDSINPIQKQLLLNFSDLDRPLDNFEGMTLGPRLSDGSQSLILVSDNNFEQDGQTELLVLRLTDVSD